jgi:hypothetical protein
MQTERTPNPRRVAAGKRTWEMLQAKRAEAARQPANGNGHSPRGELAEAFDSLMTPLEALREHVTDEQAIHDVEPAMSGNGHAQPITLVDAVLVVQDALERGELELVAHDGKPAFYRVTR